MSYWRVILWKDLLDLSRDYKTLAYIIVLPLIALPGLAIFTSALYQAQEATVYIVLEDSSDLAREIALGLADRLEAWSDGRGILLRIELREGPREGLVGDVVIVFPEGFSSNLTALDGQAIVEASTVPGSPLADSIYSEVRGYLSLIAEEASLERIERIASIAGVDVDARGVRYPLLLSRVYHAPTGEIVGSEGVRVAFASRIIAFSLFFVVNPAIIFMSDAIAGERERRSMEKLLASPVGVRDLILGKTLASLAIGLVASVVDSLALVAYFVLSGARIDLTLALGLSWFLVILLVLLVTTSIVALISSRSETIRSAQSGSFIVLAMAMAIFFSALIVDYSSLPGYLGAVLSIVPYTHAVYTIYYASVGDMLYVARHLAILLGFAAVFFWLSVRAVDVERLVTIK